MHYRYGLSWFELNDPCIPISSSCLPLIERCQKMNFSDQLILHKTGLNIAELGAKEFITPLQLQQIYENTFYFNADSEFRFITASSIYDYANPVLKQTLTNAANVEEFIELLCSSLTQAFPLHSLRLKKTDEFWFLFLDEEYFLSASDRFLYNTLYEHIFCSVCHLASSAFNTISDWEIHFSHDALSLDSIYRAHLSNNIIFNSGISMLAVPRHSLIETNPNGSNLLFDAGVRQLKEIPTTGFLGAAKRSLRVELAHTITQPQLAKQFQISTATLKRKLGLHRSSYQKLLDEVRSEEAQYMQHVLQEKEATIAELLGFFDVSNFRRSKKRWLSSN